jgi:hypothetical protein
LTNSTGNLASGTGTNSGSSSIKAATPDLIIFDSSTLSVDSMADLIFEDIGGQELLEISRSDFINSANVAFPKIKNRKVANSNKDLQSIAGSTFSIPLQSIQLSNHVPVQFDQNGNRILNPVEYIESISSIEVKVVNVLPGYQVEVQIVSQANRFNATIYDSEQGAIS